MNRSHDPVGSNAKQKTDDLETWQETSGTQVLLHIICINVNDGIGLIMTY